MSIDRRLREGLGRSATLVDPDLRETLPDALTRGRRRQRSLRASKAIAVAALAAFVAIVGPHLLHTLRSDQPATRTPTPSVPPGYAAIAGTYAASIEPTTFLRANGMVGTWSLVLRTDGVLLLTAPSTFTPRNTSATFQVHGHRFQTNTFANNICGDTVGTYRWGIGNGRLRFVKITDSCPIREAIFGARQWASTGSSAVSSSPIGGAPFIPDDGSALASGTYVTVFQPPMRLMASEGWTGNADTADFIGIMRGSDAAGALYFFHIENVFDPTTHQRSSVPSDLAGWFISHPAVMVLSPPQPTTIGGVRATEFDVQLAPGWSCGKGGSCISFAPLSPGEPDLGWSSDTAPDRRARIFVLHVHGAAVVVEFVSARNQFHDGMKAAEDVLRTVEFG